VHGSAPGAHSLLGWLPAVIPADARRFRAADEALAATIVDAGGTLDDGAPDVELADPEQLRGDAAHAVVSLDAAQSEGGHLLVRGPRRLASSLVVRARSGAVRRALRRRGYGRTSTVLWDIDHVLFVPGAEDSRRGRSVAALLPARALVAGSRRDPGPTILQEVVAEVARAHGTPDRHGWPLARQAMIVVLFDRAVLRIAVGPGRVKLEQQRLALESLAQSSSARALLDRLPLPVHTGKTGLADWALEARLPGRPPGPRLSPSLLQACIDFLVELHMAGHGGPERSSLAAAAEVLAPLCARDGDAVRELGRRLDATLEAVPRGFGHGDFWTHNLLTEGDRLTGVIDWDGAAPGRLPLLDLLHLRLSAHREQTRQYLGTAFLEHTLPWARAGGDDVARAYGRTIGLELGPERLEALAMAYWLDRVASEVAMFSDIAHRPMWAQANVHQVVEALVRRPHRAARIDA
jgi:hypothetical protein